MSLRIALYQMDVLWRQREENLAKAARFVGECDADLVILPETFSTGFLAKSLFEAETMQGQTVEWLRSTATENNKAVMGSVMINDKGKLFNRLFFCRPDGSMDWYDKRHLFSFGGEGQKVTAGRKRVIVEYKGFRILLQVCYDLRFPVWSRNVGDYDMIVYVASWDTTRINVWNTLLRARAIENQCYVAGVNRVGTDPTAHYDGSSAIIDYYGGTIAAPEQNVEEGISAEIDMEPLNRYREKFRALGDADTFKIKI